MVWPASKLTPSGSIRSASLPQFVYTAGPETRLHRIARLSPSLWASHEMARSAESQIGAGSLGRLASGKPVRKGLAPEWRPDSGYPAAESPSPMFGATTLLMDML